MPSHSYYICTGCKATSNVHLIASEESFRPLNAEARSDIASYLMGTSLMTESIGVRKANTSSGSDFIIRIPKSGISHGWRKTIATKLGINQSSVVKLDHIVKRNGGYEGSSQNLPIYVRP